MIVYLRTIRLQDFLFHATQPKICVSYTCVEQILLECNSEHPRIGRYQYQASEIRYSILKTENLNKSLYIYTVLYVQFSMSPCSEDAGNQAYPIQTGKGFYLENLSHHKKKDPNILRSPVIQPHKNTLQLNLQSTSHKHTYAHTHIYINIPISFLVPNFHM